jgi:hypothetical protein
VKKPVKAVSVLAKKLVEVGTIQDFAHFVFIVVKSFHHFIQAAYERLETPVDLFVVIFDHHDA